MTVLVAIPFWRCGPFIDEAVESVLAQTYRDLVVLVAGDGEVPSVRSTDPRVRVVSFPTNEGAPATQQAMLLGSPYRWYAAMGADDWIEPDYLARLMAQETLATASAEGWHHSDGEPTLWRDHAHTEFGVFSTDLLRSVGGYWAGKRCGQDTLLYEDLLPNVCPPIYLDGPRYHKRLWSGSLTARSDTGFGSAYRQEIVWHNAAMRDACARMGWEPERIRAYRDAHVPPTLRPILDERVEMVREALS